MERNSPINSVYLVALAVCALVLEVASLYMAAILALVTIAVFLFSVSIVAMIEKIADKNIRYLMFVLVASAVLIIFKVVCGLINVVVVKSAGEVMEFALLPCMMMAIVPIYFEDTLSVKQFFNNSFLMCLSFVLMLILFGIVTEMLGYGTFAGLVLSESFTGLELFRMPAGSFMVVATLAVIFNIVRRTFIKKQKNFETLVEKYKIIIRGIMDDEKRAEGKEENK